MIGLDTNVIYRLLFVDDARQAEVARNFVRTAIEKGETFFVNSIAMCELVWLLRSQGIERTEIVHTLENLLTASGVEVERRDETWAALADYKSKGADFADHLIGQINDSFSCQTTITFDAGLKRSPHFRVLG